MTAYCEPGAKFDMYDCLVVFEAVWPGITKLLQVVTEIGMTVHDVISYPGQLSPLSSVGWKISRRRPTGQNAIMLCKVKADRFIWLILLVD